MRYSTGRNYLRINVLSLLVFPALLLLTSCNRGGQAAPGSDAGAVVAAGPTATTQDPSGRGGRSGGGRGGRGDASGAPVPVTTARVQELSLPVFVQGVGNVEAFTTVEIRAQVTGPLLTVNFTEGQDVEKGQLLFTIDPRPFELMVKQAEAQLAKDSGQSRTLETQRARYQNLIKQGLVSQADFDTMSAQANSLQSTLALDQVAIENAKLQLQYTTILAPIAGRTGALQVHAGSLVRTADATPMVIINQITPVRVTFSLPASTLPAVRAGQARAALLTEASTSGDTADTASTGTLTFIDNVVDQTTSAIKLKATFPNRDRKLWPGEFVQVRLRLSVDPHALVVPAAAVQNGPQGQYVYIVAPSRIASIRTVRIVRSEGNNVVIADGLRAGEEVVTDGHLRLTPGARVSVKGDTTGGRS